MYERTAVLLKRKFKSYLVPTILMTMALSMGAIVDSIIVSRLLPTEAFSAVGLSQPIVLIFNTIFNFFGVGGATLAANYKGKKQDDKTNTVFSSVIVILLFLSAVFMICGLVFRRPIAALLCTDKATEQMIKYVCDYSLWLYIGSPIIILVSGCISFLRIDDMPKLGSRIIITSNVVNLICDYILVKFTGYIGGASISTVLGYLVGGLLYIQYFRSPKRTLKITKPASHIVKYGLNVAGAGITSGLNTGLMFLKNLFINQIIMGTIGALGVAAFNVCNQTMTLAALFVGGVVQTILPIIGVLNGEEDKNGIRMTMKTAFKFAFSAAIILCIVLEIGAGVLATIFALEGEAWEICRYAIRCYCLILPFYAFDFIMINYYQTIQRKLLAAILSILQGLVLVVSSVFVLSKIGDGSNLWFGFIISEAVTFAAVWILSKIYANKHDLSGLLLERKCDCTRNIEMTLSNNLQDAENVSQKIQDFCLENEVDSARALQVGICAEELITNVINYGYNRDVLQYIDVNVRIIENEVILRVRDDGITFNPVEYHTEEMSFSGIETVKKLAKSLNYSRVLGFNSSIIKV